MFDYSVPRSQRTSTAGSHSSSHKHHVSPKPPPRQVRRDPTLPGQVRRDSTLRRLPRSNNASIRSHDTSVGHSVGGNDTYQALGSVVSSDRSGDFRNISAAVCPFDNVWRASQDSRLDSKFKKLTIWEKGYQFGKMYYFFTAINCKYCIFMYTILKNISSYY